MNIRTVAVLCWIWMPVWRPVDVGGAGLPDTASMNVLLIDIEDCNAGVWGCYGNPICKTPHVDRFAAGAVRFDSAYCQAICCNPTRTSFLTGLRPLSTRVLSNADVMDEKLPPGTVTLPEMLKTKGLYTAVIGKLFHKIDYAERRIASFDRIEMYPRPKGWNGPPPMFDPAGARGDRGKAKAKARALDPRPRGKGKAYQEWRVRHSDRYGDSGLTREQEGDFQKAQVAVALLEEFAGSKKQFFLAVGQARPHTPLIAPRRYVAMYDPAAIPAPPAPVDTLRGFPYMKRATGGNPDIFTRGQPSDRQVREAIAAYYACVSFVDDNIGLVLDALDRVGLAHNTIVLFLGDHGFHLGDHGCWSKYSMLEATRRVPFIVRVPGAPANGAACRQFVEFVDIVPTLGGLLGLDLPGHLEGTSFAPLLIDPSRPWKRAVFMVDGDGGQMVRDRRHSYLEFKKGEVRTALYDLERDPWETINLADDPAHAAARDRMATLLRGGWHAALPAARGD